MCGVPVATGREPFIPDPGAPPPGVIWPQQRPTSPATPDIFSAFGNVSRPALSDVSLAAILGLLGVVVSIALLLVTPVVSLTGVTTVSSGTSVSLNLTGLLLLGGVGGSGVALTLLELWFFRRAFRRLARKNREFSTPATLTLVAMLGLVIMIVALIGLVWVLYESILCAGSGNAITLTCLNTGTILGLVAVLGVLVIVVLVGYVGLLIGVWRLGTRFEDGKFKAGAVLLIFPYLSVAGLVLILIAARSAAGKLAVPRPR